MYILSHHESFRWNIKWFNHAALKEKEQNVQKTVEFSSSQCICHVEYKIKHTQPYMQIGFGEMSHPYSQTTNPKSCLTQTAIHQSPTRKTYRNAFHLENSSREQFKYCLGSELQAIQIRTWRDKNCLFIEAQWNLCLWHTISTKMSYGMDSLLWLCHRWQAKLNTAKSPI